MQVPLYSYLYRLLPYSSDPSPSSMDPVRTGRIESDTGVEIYVRSHETDVVLPPVWRGLVQSEAGLEHHLQGLSPHFAEKLVLHNSEGRDAMAKGDWVKALLSYSHCRAMVEGELKVTDDKEAYNWLLAWADLPLALLYQLQGSAGMSDSAICEDMLERAMAMRKEMLDCVLCSVNSHPILIQVCKSYYYTSQYEWGCVTTSEVKTQAIQKFAELMGYNNHEAEPRLCLLLYIDHYFAGSFEVSLRWIEEANRIWSELSPVGSFYCLECEAKLLIKLEKFSEAAKTLEDSPYTSDYVHEQNPDYAVKVHQWLHECYTQMARGAALNGNLQQAELFEESAKLQRALGLSRDNNQSNVDTSTLPTTSVLRSSPEGSSFQAMIVAAPPAAGSSLGLVQAERHYLDPHLKKLPKVISAIFSTQFELVQNAIKYSHWEKATTSYQIMRELLQITKNVIGKDTHDWILTWVDLPLANLYHFRRKKFTQALELWKEMRDCALNLMPSDQFLARGYSRLLDAVEFELMWSDTSQAKHEIVQEWAKTCTSERSAECELYFWLYFGHYHHGHLEVSLQWLREAKRLMRQHYPDLVCSNGDYFCCEYDFLRCEADLLMKLQRFGEAAVALENLLETRHIQQGSPRLATEARQWLQKCRTQMSISATAADDGVYANLQRALAYSLDISQQRGDFVEQLQSPTGCIALAHTEQLVQSEIGLEQHLHNLPPPIHLAFRKHSELGRFGHDSADWDDAVFQFEWCKELLRFSTTAIEKETYDWLLVWTDVPLALLYEFQRKRIKRALDIRTEMAVIIKEQMPEIITDDERAMRHIVFMFLYCAMYQCAVLEYPNAKDLVVKFNASTERVNELTSENRILRRIVNQHFNSGNFAASLHFIGEGKRLLKKYDSVPEDEESPLYYVCWEAACLIYLGRPQKAEKALDEWIGAKKWNDLPAVVQYLKDWCRGKHLRERDQIEPSLSPLLQLRCDSIDREKEGKCEEAVECHEKCLKIVSDIRGVDGTMDFGHRIGFYDYSRLALLHKQIFRRRMVLFFSGAEQVTAPQQDANFARAVQCYEKCIELSLPLIDPVAVAKMNYGLVELYGIFHAAYHNYLMRRYTQLETKCSSVPSTEKDADSKLQQTLIDLHNEIVSYLKMRSPIEMYGRRASAQYANILYRTESPRLTEGWLQLLEGHKQVYTLLQEFYYGRIILYNILKKIQFRDYDDIIELHKWRAFMYAERERTRVMLYLAPDRLTNFGAFHQLRGFDIDDDLAVKTIQDCCATLLGSDNVFVQYSRMTNGTYLIYVIDQDRKLSVIHSGARAGEMTNDGPEQNLQKALNRLYAYLEPRRQPRGRRTPYDDDSMNKDLEFLHDILIKPIADHLNEMKPEHKLLLAPSQLLTKVPFAALQDRTRPRGERFLAQRHTISFTPSLRVLQSCSERLQDLQKSPLILGRGAIIAVGNPEYGGTQKALKASEGEVDRIISLFGETTVVKLLGEDASAKQLLHWVKQPSDGSSRQAFIHIGAHGKLDEANHEKSVLLLACRTSSPDTGLSINDHTSPSYKGAQEEEDDYVELEDGIDNDDATEKMTQSSMFDLVDSWSSTFRNVNSIQSQTLDSNDSSSTQNFHDSYNLRVKDISRSETKWRAELVVLSACRTSVGKLSAEGVLSLARAFMIAGVPSVIASQWNVLDDATRDLMIAFYEYLQTGEDVASALRSALLRMLEKGHTVREWAPFVIWGLPTVCVDPSLQRKNKKNSEELRPLRDAGVNQESVPVIS